MNPLISARADAFHGAWLMRWTTLVGMKKLSMFCNHEIEEAANWT
ncbi:hypothetical protein ACQKII_11655 [Lysinibacillus sp. NPDC048646]